MIKVIKWDHKLAFWRLTDVLWKSLATSYPFRRLCMLMHQMGTRTLVAETVDSSCREYTRIQAEMAAISQRLGASIICSASKLTFLALPLSESDFDRIPSVPESSFLGYAILITVTSPGPLGGPPKRMLSFLFESVIRENGSKVIATGPDGGEISEADISNHFLHVKRTFNATVAKRSYKILGTYFCQQNTFTSVCAHACATMMLNNCRAVDSVVTCEDINRHLGIDHRVRMLKIDSRWGSNDFATHIGLDLQEMAKVFRQYGLASYRATFDDKQRKFREFLYGFVESGFPALLTFRASREEVGDQYHVVAVVGHTLNPGSWFPLGYAFNVERNPNTDRCYLSSIDWVDDFIMHDDGLGMQLCLPVYSFRPEGRPDTGLKFAPVEALGVFPIDRNVVTTATVAEHTAWSFAHRVLRGIHEQCIVTDLHYYVRHLLVPLLSSMAQTAVFRTLLVGRDDYLNTHLLEEDSKGQPLSKEAVACIARQTEDCPYLWLTEISEPELYVGGNAKVADVLSNPSFQQPEQGPETESTSGGVILMFLPGAIVVPDGSVGFRKVMETNTTGFRPLFKLKDD